MNWLIFNRLLNHLLQHDVQFVHQWSVIEPQWMVVEVNDLGWIIGLLLQPGKIEIAWGEPKSCDARVSGKFRDYLYYLMSKKVTDGVFGLQITGDQILVQRWHRIWSQLDIDWQEIFAPYLGDVVVHAVANMGQGVWRRFDDFNQMVKRGFTEFLHYELQVLPCREEINDFLDDVDQLQMAVDRLTARWAEVDAR